MVIDEPKQHELEQQIVRTQALLDCFAEGASIANLAKLTGRDAEAIAQLVAQVGVKPPTRPPEVRSRPHWSSQGMPVYRLNRRNRAICGAYRAGVSVRTLAKIYYLHPATVYAVLEQSGVERGYQQQRLEPC